MRSDSVIAAIFMGLLVLILACIGVGTAAFHDGREAGRKEVCREYGGLVVLDQDGSWSCRK